MLKHSILGKQIGKSPLLRQETMGPKNHEEKPALSPSLMLTPLVDAFAILVIYLLVNTSAADHQLKVDAELNLPMAQNTKALDKGLVVKFSKGKYYIDGEHIKKSKLENVLAERLEETSGQLVVQADHLSHFKSLSPIMTSGSAAGYTKIRFAVLQGAR